MVDTGNPELDALAEKVKAAFDSLTPEKKAAMRRDSYISFVYGNLACSTNHRVPRELVERTVDEMVARGELNFNRDT